MRVIALLILLVCKTSLSQILPTSNYIGGIFNIHSNSNELKVNETYLIQAIAVGYYNTELTATQGEIKLSQEHLTYYTFTPKEVGEIIFNLYGKNNEGEQGHLGQYKYTVVENKSPVTSLETENRKILFRGYENTIVPISTNNQKLKLTCNNCLISKTETNKWTLRPGMEKITTINTHLINPDRSLKLIRTEDFEVLTLPVPNIYLSEKRSGEIINSADSVLSVGYDYGFPIVQNFIVTSWEAKINDQVFKGFGSNVNSVLDYAKKQKQNTKITFITRVKSEDDSVRRKKGIWYYWIEN